MAGEKLCSARIDGGPHEGKGSDHRNIYCRIWPGVYSIHTLSNPYSSWYVMRN